MSAPLLRQLMGFGEADRARLILIAGGQGKGQDFSDLRAPIGAVR